MKQKFHLLSIVFMFTACQQDPMLETSYYVCNTIGEGNAELQPKHVKYQQLIDDMVISGVPGIMMSVSDNESAMWSGASGKADLASDIDLLPCHITRVGSTVKTFTAVTILLLQEEGKLDLEDLTSKYLSDDYLKGLANADHATIRQLLQHTSGIYNYIHNPQFQTASLNDLTKTWQKEGLLAYARNQPAQFETGTDAQYSNTNYILLGDIIEAIEQKPFYKVFEEKIFNPLGLSNTQFAAEDPVPEGIIQGYVDFYSNLNVINSTYFSGWDYFTADGGLISNAYDLNIFLNELFNGNIISEASMAELINWKVPNEQIPEGFKTYYGLGIFRIDTDYGPAYLHSGDAIGYFASMVHFPNQNTTITWAVNGNYGAIDEFTQSKVTMKNIFQTVLM